MAAKERGRLRKALSNVREMVFPRSGWRMWQMPRSDFNYGREVGDGTGSSTVMAPLNWIARTFPAAPVELYKLLEDGQEEVQVGHDLVRLLHRPNPYYTGKLLWQATALDYYVDGNAYWLKLRNKAGAPAQLWWVPSTLIEPKPPDNGDTSVFVDYYDYRPNGTQIKLSSDDVVHFRFGIDPDDQRKGRSPMKSVLREIFTDDEAANYTAALLKNMGVPGILVAPKEGGNGGPGPEDIKATKDYLKHSTTGDRRGEPLVMSGPTELEQFGFSPDQMNLKDLRRIPEERVTAVLGIPAIVCGLGAGLDRSTFANFAEARKAAYESNIIPAQEVMVEDVRFQLLPDFEDDPMAWKTAFDLSDVRILQEDENKKAERLNVGVKGGWVKRGEARREMGFEATEDDDIYLVPISLMEVGADGQPRESALDDEPPEQDPSKQIEEEEPEEDEQTKGLKAIKAIGPRHQQMAKALMRDRLKLEQAAQVGFSKQLDELGTKVAAAFGSVVTDVMLEQEQDSKVKVKDSDIEIGNKVLAAAKLAAWEAGMKKELQVAAARTYDQTLETIKKALDLDEIPKETFRQAVINKGGVNKGLQDIDGEIKKHIIRAVGQGREAGMNTKELTDLIRREVPKGRFVNAGKDYRSQMIARTETRYSQNISMAQIGRATGQIKKLLAIDGTGDEDCAERNGQEYSFADAEFEAEKEHPNGTLMFVPVVEEGGVLDESKVVTG